MTPFQMRVRFFDARFIENMYPGSLKDQVASRFKERYSVDYTEVLST